MTQPTVPTLTRPESRSIPYRWATPGQHAQAVLWVTQQLHDHFPALSVAAFAQAFHQFQPELWEDRNGLWLDYTDLVRLTQQVARSPLVPDFEPPIYCADAYYLAELYDYLSQVAIGLRPELEASALGHNSRLMALIERLANGDAVAERVLRETRNEPRRATTDPA